MISESQLVLAFGTGFFLQVLRFLNWKLSYKDYTLLLAIFLSAAIYPLLSLYMFLKEGEWMWDLSSFGLIFFSMLGVLMYTFFKEKLIQPITRQTVVTCFLVIGYWYLSNFSSAEIPFVVTPLFLILLPLFIKKEFPVWTEVLYHSTLLLLLLIFGWSQMNWSGFSVFTEHPQNGSTLDLLNALVAGGIFGYLLPQSYFLISLIPIRKKGQSAREKEKEMKQLKKILCDNFLEEHPTTGILLIQSTLLICILISNYLYQWISPLILINTILILFPMLTPLIRLKPKP